MNKRRSSILAVLGFSLIAYSSSVRAEQEFTDLVAKVMPSVVNIAIEAMGQRVKLEQSGGDLAYATYVVQGLFQKYLPGAFDWYVIAAIPVERA